MRSIIALVIVTATGVATGTGEQPLRLGLVAGHGETTIHLVATSTAEPSNEIDMHLPWWVGTITPDGTASVRIGPPRFSGSGTPPLWPRDGYAIFDLSPEDRDRNWRTGLPSGTAPDEMNRLQEILSPQYSIAVGIVRLPLAAVEIGGEWSFVERESSSTGPLVTSYAYRLLAREGKRVRISVAQSTRRNGGGAPVTVETVRGEITYELDKPLPVGGWLVKSRTDGSIAYRYR
jgi:hypothetical protein